MQSLTRRVRIQQQSTSSLSPYNVEAFFAFQKVTYTNQVGLVNTSDTVDEGEGRARLCFSNPRQTSLGGKCIWGYPRSLLSKAMSSSQGIIIPKSHTLKTHASLARVACETSCLRHSSPPRPLSQPARAMPSPKKKRPTDHGARRPDRSPLCHLRG